MPDLSAVLRALLAGPLTLAQLAEATGLSAADAEAALKAAHRELLVMLAWWNPSGGAYQLTDRGRLACA